MAPPTFADLGKQARDLFGKGYNHGLVKVETTTRANSNSNIEFKTSASHSLEKEKLAGTIDVKYKVPQYGVVFTEKLNTDGSLGTVLEVNDQFARGLKVTLDSLYVPNTGKREATLKTEWFNDVARLNSNISLLGGPVINLSGVVNRQGWLLGAQGKFDVATNEMKGVSCAFGYQGPEYTLHSYTNNGQEFGGSLYHQVHKSVDVGASLGWTNGQDKTNYALGAIYRVNPDLALRGKVDNKSVVGIAATHTLSNNLKATLSTQFGLTTANAQHKLGFGLEYTA